MGVDCRGNDFGDAKLAASAAACQETRPTLRATTWSTRSRASGTASLTTATTAAGLLKLCGARRHVRRPWGVARRR